jgi:hypothetical protein
MAIGVNEQGYHRRVRRLIVVGVSVLLASASILAKQVPADAAGNCRYQVSVQRQEGRVLRGRVCDPAELVNWLQAFPGASTSAEPPAGELLDSFTVTISFAFNPDLPYILSTLVSEHVYPYAQSGPVAYVPSRTASRPPARWPVNAGWRTIDPTSPVPAILRRLGLASVGTSGSSSPTAPSQPASSAGSRPDLVTLGFLLVAGLVIALAIGKRKAARRGPPG